MRLTLCTLLFALGCLSRYRGLFSKGLVNDIFSECLSRRVVLSAAVGRCSVHDVKFTALSMKAVRMEADQDLVVHSGSKPVCK